MNEPTEKQLDFLKRLGYTGGLPRSSAEASQLISGLKCGGTSKVLENALFERRLAKQMRQIEVVNRDLDSLDEMIQNSNGMFKVSGYRLKVLKSDLTPENSIYNKAFLPLRVARRFPQILTIEGVDYIELQRVPSKGPVVVGAGVVKDMAEYQSQGGGCIVLIFALGGTFLSMAALFGWP